MFKYHHRSHSKFSIKYHFVFCTKYRRQILIGDFGEYIKAQMIVLTKSKFIIDEIEVDKDHIHILVDIDPQYGVHRLIKLIKGRSSFLLRREFKFLKRTMPCMWTNSYFVSTVGGAPLKVVKQYIESQKLRLS